MGDPREPTPTFIRDALVDARRRRSRLPARGRAAGAARGGRRLARAPLRRRASTRSARSIPTLGSKEAIFLFAQVVACSAEKDARASSPSPAIPVYERGALFAGARRRAAAAARGERLAARPRRDRRRRGTRSRSSGSTTRTTRPGAVAPLVVLRGARRRARASTASCSPPTRRTRSSGSTSRRRRRCRSPTATNVVVFNTLSKRSSMTGYRSGFVCAPPELVAALRAFRPTRRHGAAGVRPARVGRRVERRGARRATCASVYARKRERSSPALERAGLRLAGGEATFYLWLAVRRRAVGGVRARGCSSTASSSRPARSSARPARATSRLALVPTHGGVRARGGDPARRCCERASRRRSRRSTAASVRVARSRDGEWVVERGGEGGDPRVLPAARRWSRSEVGPFEYHDKIPLKRGYEELGVRVVPPATARYGAFLSRGVVLMPSYVNIGAWVGPRTMVDTWATVGSCAQIGADVHLAGGVGIGGVLEPPGARPVIVEDGAFVGSRCDRRRGRASSASRRCSRRTSSLTRVGADHRRHRRRSRSSTAATCRRASVVVPGHAAEGVPGRHVPARRAR